MQVKNDKFSVGNCADAITDELTIWQNENKIISLWGRDARLWTHTDESNWMGWLDVAAEKNEISRTTTLANELRSEGINDIVLMGMGGSSLCPAMMAETFGKIANYPRLHILDSTDPLQILHLEEQINLKKTFFIVSSKSGNTLEPNIFLNYFYARLQSALNKTEVGNYFLAITDPGTALETIAKKNQFRAIFHGVPAIGGRYSALSNFGMVPSGLMGVDIKEFLNHAEIMQEACSPNVLIKDNPGVVLGVVLGICAKQGKDKVTLIVSPEIHSLGAWLEQLLAESTGKEGKGLIPVDQEAIGVPSVYDNDRVFVYIRLESAPDAEQDRSVLALEQSGFVVVRLSLPDKMYLGAELFRWEIATAVAGSVLGINAFNQPDVEESKILCLQMTNEYEKSGHLNQPTPFFSEHGIQLFTDEINQKDIANYLVGEPSVKNYLRAHLERVKKDDYVDLSAFIEMSAEHTDLLQKIRIQIRDTKKVATCLGFGPRFLHSTGQAYKGGPNTGVFLQITADHSEDIKVPSHNYTFGIVITAQAQADFSVLTKRLRRVLRIHLGNDVRGGLEQLKKFIG
ncbi:MAG: bifunctional transaldolase/phosoglucose isomerase [Gammaproteobacteria bacterium]|nr:bifunctional transaldolase/phosoglucose isomerase [Gammaproteobacteria bacterium]